MELANAHGASSAPTGSTARTGLMIIRTWTEEGSAEPLRAHIRLTEDLSAGIERTFTVCREEEVVAEVQAWLATTTGEAEKPA